MSFLDLSKQRYSCRAFSSREVEQEKIDDILEVVRNAPTARNLQAQYIYVIKSQEGLAKAKLATPCTYNSPLVFLVCIDMDKVWHSTSEVGVDTADIDGSIVTTQMALEAFELGLGSCIVRMFDSKKVQEIFNLPSNIKPILFLPVGYPALKGGEASPRHRDRKKVEEFYKVI